MYVTTDRAKCRTKEESKIPGFQAVDSGFLYWIPDFKSKNLNSQQKFATFQMPQAKSSGFPESV